jgi:hypothetical protein
MSLPFNKHTVEYFETNLTGSCCCHMQQQHQVKLNSGYAQLTCIVFWKLRVQEVQGSIDPNMGKAWVELS